MKIILIMAMFLVAGFCWAGDYRTWIITTGTNAATAVTGYADPFTGPIDEILVYTSSGVTGAVTIAAIDPYDSSALVLATNATITGRMLWRPRIMPPAITGATSLTVTNAVTDDRFNAHGERIRAIISSASATNEEFRIYLKIKN